MFKSFFPKPRWLLISAMVWTGFAFALWSLGASNLGGLVGAASPSSPNGMDELWTKPFLWRCIYCFLNVVAFAAVWRFVSPHRWWVWSILGTAGIFFGTYIQVEVLVVITRWIGLFYDTIQSALTRKGHASISEFYSEIRLYVIIASIYVIASVVTAFLTSHYIFRWRIAMNDYYIEHWSKLREIEGAAQRIQEDTMRFSTTMETLGASFINAIMTLVAFLPVLAQFSAYVHVLPVVGVVPMPLVTAAVVWSLLGTLFLMAVGVKLPGIQFANQKMEAAYRKELVYGEDNADRAQRAEVNHLFSNVRKSYYYLYFHYTYFNAARFSYQVADNVYAFFVLIPTIMTGAITLGVLVQIFTVFGQVRTSFQYLITSAPTIVELMSIYKRLRGFEARIYDEPLPEIEARSIEAFAG